MKVRHLGLVLVFLGLQSCTVTKRYHSFGFNVDWNVGGSQDETNERVEVDRFNCRYGKSIKSSEVMPIEVVSGCLKGPEQYPCNSCMSDTVVQINDSIQVDSMRPQETAALAKLAKLKRRIAKRWRMSVAIILGSTGLSITADAIAHTELSRVGLWVIFIFYPIALLIAFLAILASMTYLYLKIRYNQKFKKKGAGRS